MAILLIGTIVAGIVSSYIGLLIEFGLFNQSIGLAGAFFLLPFFFVLLYKLEELKEKSEEQKK